MTISRTPKMIILAIISISLCYVAWRASQPLISKSFLKGVLKLEELPSSINNIKCDSNGITEYMASCYFEINPKDATLITLGLEMPLPIFDNKPSHDYSVVGGLVVGPTFTVRTVYSKALENKGFIKILMNETKSQVRVDIFQQ